MNENNRAMKHPVQEIADAVGGTITEAGALPDGSGFAIMSMPLPKDHWLYKGDVENSWGPSNVPPMPFRIGSNDRAVFGKWNWWTRFVWRAMGRPTFTREEMADRIRAAAKYAARCATMNGKDMDFDPDALVQNFVIGMLGYWTADGLSSETWANPEPRAQWCCDGDGRGGHAKRCRYSKEDYANSAPPVQR